MTERDFRLYLARLALGKADVPITDIDRLKIICGIEKTHTTQKLINVCNSVGLHPRVDRTGPGRREKITFEPEELRKLGKKLKCDMAVLKNGHTISHPQGNDLALLGRDKGNWFVGTSRMPSSDEQFPHFLTVLINGNRRT